LLLLFWSLSTWSKSPPPFTARNASNHKLVDMLKHIVVGINPAPPARKALWTSPTNVFLYLLYSHRNMFILVVVFLLSSLLSPFQCTLASTLSLPERHPTMLDFPLSTCGGQSYGWLLHKKIIRPSPLLLSPLLQCKIVNPSPIRQRTTDDQPMIHRSPLLLSTLL
jgi:hypothetical protein